MRVVVQRVKNAEVVVDHQSIGKIGKGLLVFAAWEESDSFEDVDWMCQKIVNQRIFSDADGKMNLSILDISGDILLVSQFTLFASTKKGNRPSFIRSAKPEKANELYELCQSKFRELLGKGIQTGEFGADMSVNLSNDGPVTITMDSRNKE